MKKGAVLIEVLVALFITSVVFITVYTTISISLINTNYLKQARESANFASQLSEAFSACAESQEYSMFDYIKEKHGSVAGVTEIDIAALNTYMASVPNGDSFLELIDENNMTEEQVDMAIGVTRKFMSPFIAIPSTIAIYAFIGLLYSLIIGAIVKKDRNQSF